MAISAEGSASAADALLITTEARGEWTVLHLYGELDLATVPVLHRYMDQVVRVAAEHTAVPVVAVELTGLAFCDSSGLAALIRGYKQIVLAGSGRLLLLNPRPRLVDILAHTGVDRYLTVATDLPDRPNSLGLPA